MSFMAKQEQSVLVQGFNPSLNQSKAGSLLRRLDFARLEFQHDLGVDQFAGSERHGESRRGERHGLIYQAFDANLVASCARIIFGSVQKVGHDKIAAVAAV